MKKLLALSVGIALTLSSVNSFAQQNILKKVKVYFNHPVDNSFSSGVNANYVHNAIMDTIAAYISRAKYTIDIAQYDYSAYSTDTVAHIATAINNAYSRGVKIRWICDSASSNVGLSLFSAGVKTLKSKGNTTGAIMHNKFIVIDEFDSLNAIVSTGSEDWSDEMNDFDYNNLVFIQSRVLARAFTNEFNIMWGDTTHGAAANKAAAKFSTSKPNSGTHTFTIAGSQIDLYFSPSDGCNTQVINVINAAKSDMYCAMYDFTQTQYANPFKTKSTGGVYSSCILDQYSSGSTAYTTMSGTTNFVEYTGGCCSYIYHNKYIDVNPSNTCDGPTVLTGSMNWTAAGYDLNDENIIIIHNDTIANLYLQSYAKDYETISGKSLVKQTGCLSGVDNINENVANMKVFPNPFNQNATIQYTLAADEKVSIVVYNIMGQQISTLADNEMQDAGEHQYSFNGVGEGVYIVRLKAGEGVFTEKLVQVK